MGKPKSKKKRLPWVNFQRDPKSGRIVMSRRDVGAGAVRLVFPSIPGDINGEKEARFVWEGSSTEEPDEGYPLTYSDVQWLAQALPELLNEMERAGIEE